MSVIKLFLFITAIGLMSVSGLLAQSAEKPLSSTTVGSQEAPETWRFNFDSRPWRLGHQEAAPQMSIREYVLQGETVEAWSEMVTSFFVARQSVTVEDMFKNFKKLLSQDCPSLSLSIIERSDTNILFEWQHQGCRGNPPQHEIKRIARGPGGILFLAYVAKATELSEERRNAWISILRDATPTTVASQPAPVMLKKTALVPGVSLVNMAAALGKDALGKLGSFAKKKYGCGSVTVVDTKYESGGDKMLMDGKGRLLSGLAVERWAVIMCGKLRNLSLAFRADGQGGSEIAISEIEPDK